MIFQKNFIRVLIFKFLKQIKFFEMWINVKMALYFNFSFMLIGIDDNYSFVSVSPCLCCSAVFNEEKWQKTKWIGFVCCIFSSSGTWEAMNWTWKSLNRKALSCLLIFSKRKNRICIYFFINTLSSIYLKQNSELPVQQDYVHSNFQISTLGGYH